MCATQAVMAWVERFAVVVAVAKIERELLLLLERF